jgi:transposase
MRRAPRVALTQDQHDCLLAWARGRRTPVRVAERARILILAGEGLTDKDIAAREGCDRRTVARWRKRFLAHGLAGIENDAPRPETARRIPPEQVVRVVDKTRSEPPPNGKRWSTRAMAQAVGLSEASVRRIWRSVGLQQRLDESPPARVLRVPAR